MILGDELIKAVGRDDRHHWYIDSNPRKGAGVDLLCQEVLDEDESAGLAPERTRPDLCVAEGALPELTVEYRQLRNQRLQAGHRYLRLRDSRTIVSDARRQE